jgi:hypothetical protein
VESHIGGRTLVAPGTANSLKMNGASPISIVEAITNQLVDPNSFLTLLKRLRQHYQERNKLVKKFGIIPFTTGLGGDYIYARNYGERIPLRGGGWNDAASAGLFALYLSFARGSANTTSVFALLYIVICLCPLIIC